MRPRRITEEGFVITGIYGKSLPLKDASFDLVVSLWTFEHVENPAHIFSEIFRVLRPGGTFAFVTPNKHSLLIQLRRLLNKKTADRLLEAVYGRKDNDVFDVFYRANSVHDIRQLADKTGFKVDHLAQNQDPSYTSFGPLSYSISAWMSSWKTSFSKPHLIAILQKPPFQRS